MRIFPSRLLLLLLPLLIVGNVSGLPQDPINAKPVFAAAAAASAAAAAADNSGTVAARAATVFSRWLSPFTQIRTQFGLRTDKLMAALQKNPRSAKLLDFLYQNKEAVYVASICFIVGASILIMVLVIHNPIFRIAASRRQKRRFTLDNECPPEVECMPVKKASYRASTFTPGGGDTVPLLNSQSEGPGVGWISTRHSSLTTVRHKQAISAYYGTILQLCKQEQPVSFADVLSLNNRTVKYVLEKRSTQGNLYCFNGDAMTMMVKIVPVFSGSISERQTFLRRLLYLNRLHSCSSNFLCRNFVEIKSAKFVQDDFPKSLNEAVTPTEAHGSASAAAIAPTDARFYSCRNYIVLSMEYAGTALSRCAIKSAVQAKSIVQQLCFTLSAGERFAGYSVGSVDVDRVLLRTAAELTKVDFRIDGLSVAVRLVDGLVARLAGTSFDLDKIALDENHLIEAADRRISAPAFHQNVEFLSTVVGALLARIPRDVPAEQIRNEQNIIFDLKDIESHLRNFDCVYHFTMFKFIQPKRSLATISVDEANIAVTANP